VAVGLGEPRHSVAQRRLKQPHDSSLALATPEDLASARKLKDPLARTTALLGVAKSSFDSGDKKEAKTALDEASKTAERMDTSAVPSTVFAEISRGYSSLGAYRASRLAANRCSSPVDKLSAYLMILERYFKLPLTRG